MKFKSSLHARWRKLNKSQAFLLGFLVGTFLGIGIALLVFSSNGYLAQNPESPQIHATSTSPFPPPAFLRVIPETASVGEEIVIRGGKFGPKGKICFVTCTQQFEILAWTSGSIRAKVPPVTSDIGELWLVDGTGQESPKVSFEVVD